MKKYARSPNKQKIVSDRLTEEFSDEINKYYFLRDLLGYRYFSSTVDNYYETPIIRFVRDKKHDVKVTELVNGSSVSWLQLPRIIINEYAKMWTATRSVRGRNRRSKVWCYFLEAWPPEYREDISRLKLSKLLKVKMDCYSSALQNEHGDFTKNNLKFNSGKILLTDFDFFKKSQPIGFDLYDLLSSFKIPEFFKAVLIPNYKLNKCKFELIGTINDFIDASVGLRPGLIAVDDPIVDTIMLKGCSNLNPIETALYDNRSRRKSQMWFIFSKEDNCFYWIVFERYGKKLFLSGTANQLLEGSDIPFLSVVTSEWLKQLLKFGVREAHISGVTNQQWLEQILYDFEGDEDFSLRINVDTIQPYREAFVPLKKSLREDYRRLKRKFQKIGGYEVTLKITDDVDLTCIKKWHASRWPNGQFAKRGPYFRYVNALISSGKLHSFKLYVGGRLEAINCGLLHREQFISILNVSSFDNAKHSYGKFLLMEAIQKYDHLIFNFGTGAEQYKKLFSVNANVIFSVVIRNTKHIHRLKKIKRKLF